MKTSWNKGLTKSSDPRVASSAKKISASSTGRASTPEAERLRREKISATAKVRGTIGGYRASAGRTKKHVVLDSFGNETCLQSTHELRLAEVLNKHGLKWKREGCFFYGKKRYFPDFHLVDLDVYLDVKNEYLIKVDAEKIALVKEHNPGLVLHVFTIDQAECLCSSMVEQSADNR